MEQTAPSNTTAVGKSSDESPEAEQIAFFQRADDLMDKYMAKMQESIDSNRIITALLTEQRHIVDMFSIITNEGLYNTAMEFYEEGERKLKLHKDKQLIIERDVDALRAAVGKLNQELTSKFSWMMDLPEDTA